MASPLELFAFKVAGPVGVVVVAGIAMQSAGGVEVTATEMGVAAVCLFVVDRILRFAESVLGARTGKNPPKVEVSPTLPPEAMQKLERMTELMESMRDELVDQRRFCRLNSASGQREVGETVADAVERRGRPHGG